MNTYYITKQEKKNDSDIIYTSSTDILHDYLNIADVIGCDTETTGFDAHTCKVLCAQFGDKNQQFVLNCEEFDLKAFKPYLEDINKGYIFQNAKFDLGFFLVNGIDIKTVMDTFLAELVLTMGYDKEHRILHKKELGLEALADRYCGAKLDKTIRSMIHKEGLTPRVVKYAAEDVVYLHDILEKQMIQIKKRGLENVFDLECRVTKVFAKMEHTGIALDADKWSTISDYTEKECENLVIDLDKEITTQSTTNPKLTKYLNAQIDLFSGASDRTLVNWSSPAQKKVILEDAGLDMKDGVGDRELQRSKMLNSLIPMMINYSKMSKLASSFGREFLKNINPATNRVHYNIWPILATGRISVSDPNLNQIPSKGELGAKIRSCFIPKEGYKIVGGDYSGMELRIIAEFSKDPLWVDAFKNGGDLHSILCAKTFDIPIEDVKKPFPGKPDLKYRDVQKTINFGLAYGMSEFKLADTMQIDVAEAKRLIDKFFAVVPKVEQFLNMCADYAMGNGFIKTSKPFNRIRVFPEWHKASKYNITKHLEAIGRKGKNTPIQGTNGDIIKLALVKTQEFIDKNDYPAAIILAVYDEIQTECREDKAEEFKEIVNKIMVEAAESVIIETPIVVDCAISDCWENKNNMINWNEQHCGLRRATYDNIIEYMPDLKEIIDTFPDNPKDFYWDIKVHMLMPNQFPCIPNWHYDNVPRDKNNEQDFTKCRLDLPMFLWVSNTPTTEFKRIDGDTFKIKPQTWLKFYQDDLHRGTASEEHCWRGFIRATHKDIISKQPSTTHNPLRRHSQVYLDANKFMW